MSIIQTLRDAHCFVFCMLVLKFSGPLQGRKPREKGRRLDEDGTAGEKFVSLCFGVHIAHRQESVA